MFYVNLPIGILALVMIATGLRKQPAGRSHAIDYPGAVLLASATAALLLLLAWGGTEFAWLSVQSAGLAVLTVGLWAAFSGGRRGRLSR